MGWSEGVFQQELMALYTAYRQGRANPLPPLRVQYADFPLWQREWLAQGVLAKGLTYWTAQLAGIPAELELPKDRPRTAAQTFEAESCEVELSAAQSAGLTRLSQENNATLYMTLLAGMAVLLARYSGQDDIVVGTPIANRQDAALEDLIGFFVNTLVMRTRVTPGLCGRDLLAAVRQTALAAYEHQDVPFERLVQELGPERSLSRTLVFQVLFAVQNAPSEPPRLPDLEVQAVAGAGPRTRFDLEVHVRMREGRILVGWLYKRDLFDRWRMEQMAAQYVRVLEALAADPDQDVGRIDVLGPAAHRQIVETWNDTAVAFPRARETLGFLTLNRRSPAPFTPDELSWSAQAAAQAAIALENALAFREIAALKDRLAREHLPRGRNSRRPAFRRRRRRKQGAETHPESSWYGGGDRRERVVARRDGHRKGAHRASRSRGKRAPRPIAGDRQLRHVARGAARERVVRPRGCRTRRHPARARADGLGDWRRGRRGRGAWPHTHIARLDDAAPRHRPTKACRRCESRRSRPLTGIALSGARRDSVPTNITIVQTGDFVRAKPDGRLDFDTSRKLLVGVVSAMRTTEEHNALIDTRAAAPARLSKTDLWNLGVAAGTQPALDEGELRAGPLDKQDDAELFEDVARVEGANVRAFPDFESAISWLIMHGQARM